MSFLRIVAAAILGLPAAPGLASYPALPAVAHAQWQERCGRCHILYHPGLLPERSWRRLMDQQKSHFGPNLGLASATAEAIAEFLAAHAADRSQHPLSKAVAGSLSAWERPTRITATDWFEETHARVRKVDFMANCAVCHADYAAGDYRVKH